MGTTGLMWLLLIVIVVLVAMCIIFGVLLGKLWRRHTRLRRRVCREEAEDAKTAATVASLQTQVAALAAPKLQALRNAQFAVDETQDLSSENYIAVLFNVLQSGSNEAPDPVYNPDDGSFTTSTGGDGIYACTCDSEVDWTFGGSTGTQASVELFFSMVSPDDLNDDDSTVKYGYQLISMPGASGSIKISTAAQIPLVAGDKVWAIVRTNNVDTATTGAAAGLNQFQMVFQTAASADSDSESDD